MSSVVSHHKHHSFDVSSCRSHSHYSMTKSLTKSEHNKLQKIHLNKKIISFIKNSKDTSSVKLIQDFIARINKENGSSIKFTKELYDCLIKMTDFCLLFDVLNKIIIKIGSDDNHQFYEHECYCVYHDGDSLLMHLFMCAIVVGAKILETGVSMDQMYKDTNIPLVVINMIIAFTHDIGKLDCAVHYKDRNFVGFPFHGQVSSATLLNLWKYQPIMKSINMSYKSLYLMSLTTNFHMDYYSSKKGSKNHDEIMTLARWMANDVVEELTYLFYGDNLAKFTPSHIQDRKFKNAQSLEDHASYFKRIVSCPIEMDELKTTLKLGDGILVFAINGSVIRRRVPIGKRIIEHSNVIEINNLSSNTKLRIDKYLKEGKVVIINVPEVLLKLIEDYIPEGDFLKLNLIYSDGIDDNLCSLPALLSTTKCKSGRGLKSYCSKYIKDGIAHASIPYDGICENYILKVFNCI